MTKEKVYAPRTCVICGREYLPVRKDQKTCGDPDCRNEQRKITQTAWRKRNLSSVRERNLEYMHRRRHKNKPKKDTIIGEGYAERQMAKTLAMVGHIKTEL